jgi:bud site selection protein 20
MGRLARKKVHRNHGTSKDSKTRKRNTKDLDQIWDETQPDKIEKSKKDATEYDEDKPGLGQFYCLACSRYFVTETVLTDHFKTKTHKKRLILLIAVNLLI